jgi:hypothetical protein
VLTPFLVGAILAYLGTPIVAAMEPRPRGRQVTAAGELEKLRQANQKLKRDAERGPPPDALR